MSKRRLGRFLIPRNVIIETPEIAKEILKDKIIYRAEMLLHVDAVEYMAISDEFDLVELGEEAPVYQVLIQADLDENKVIMKRR